MHPGHHADDAVRLVFRLVGTGALRGGPTSARRLCTARARANTPGAGWPAHAFHAPASAHGVPRPLRARAVPGTPAGRIAVRTDVGRRSAVATVGPTSAPGGVGRLHAQYLFCRLSVVAVMDNPGGTAS